MSERVASSRAAYRAAYHYAAMAELDHLQADVLKDLSKMVIAGVGMIVLLALLLWGLVTSAEAAGLVTVRSHVSNDPFMSATRPSPAPSHDHRTCLQTRRCSDASP
jgi:hypothetical protein